MFLSKKNDKYFLHDDKQKTELIINQRYYVKVKERKRGMVGKLMGVGNFTGLSLYHGDDTIIIQRSFPTKWTNFHIAINGIEKIERREK